MQSSTYFVGKVLRPYLLIALAGIFAFAPVSFMTLALKNDIVALEYPINHFMSQCIHHGEMPYWFNTWGMGFPLHSNLTWGLFSTPQMIFCAIFNYNIYTLHFELIFFILLSGWSMYYLLQKWFIKDGGIALLLAICYMLSGFTVGSAQWLLYITAAAFIPMVISSLLSLLESPSAKKSIQFAIVYAMMATSVYAAFNIITSYALLIWLIVHFLNRTKSKESRTRLMKCLLFAFVGVIILCGPMLYYTLELLGYMSRGDSIANRAYFFNSNYLPPAGLANMFFPLSAPKMNFTNTEGTMLDVYCGLFTLLLIPFSIISALKQRKILSWFLPAAALLFLLISFGSMTPLRDALNILPGFSYFRNPGIFRLYFILSLLLFLGTQLRNKTFEELFNLSLGKKPGIIQYSLWLMMAICLIVFVMNASQLRSISFHSLSNSIRNLNLRQLFAISAAIQYILLATIYLAAKGRHFRFVQFVLAFDLILNACACTPFFVVSSQKPSMVNAILKSAPGFPIQSTAVSEVPAVFTDERGNVWNNINVFNKQVSLQDSYRGPLNLKNGPGLSDSSLKGKQLVFSANQDSKVSILLQKPSHVKASVSLMQADTITLLQNYYPGWMVFYNGNKVERIKSDKPGISVLIPAGEGKLDFRYERKPAWISAIMLHLVVLTFLIWKVICIFKRRKI